MERLSPQEVQTLNEQFEDKEPQALLQWGLEVLHPRISLASSFGAEDVVLIDMLWRINPQAGVFSLDTLRLNTETYDVIDRIRDKYKVSIDMYTPSLDSVATMVEENGYNLFHRAVEMRKLCCGIRKVEPLNRALSTLDAWIAGLRRQQGVTRVSVPKLEIDASHGGILKLNPLADWTWDQVWEYIRANDIPYNALHDQGYPSIGCAPCTRAIEPGEDMRAGRWWWEDDPALKECGLHEAQSPAGAGAKAGTKR